MNNEELIARIEALEKWKADREKQQITFPLDVQSINILNNYFMRITGSVITTGGVSGNTFIEFIGQQKIADIQFPTSGRFGTTKEFVVSQNPYYQYTVNPTSNVFTLANGAVFDNDMQIYPVSSDTVPAPLVSGTNYFVINASGSTFKLSATQGGAEINITDSGTGKQYFLFF